jgi:hypothetical protein
MNQISPMPLFSELLRAEGDQHAENYDPNFAYKGTPAVKRLRDMEVHEITPPEKRRYQASKSAQRVNDGRTCSRLSHDATGDADLVSIQYGAGS